MYLSLAGQVESQLREAYGRRHAAGQATQSGLADKLGINRSAVHHRLMGHHNMTIETIADMVWALGHDIRVRVFDPSESRSNSEANPNADPLVDDVPLTDTGASNEKKFSWRAA